ncbi:MAG: hypothetical protein COA76_11990 [Moritella sp.]|nr:MAG: hypothetical protein COA76_11990 [Moritella sp.]
MSIFKKANEELRNKIQITKVKSPNNSITKHKNGKCLYLRVLDKTKTNKNGSKGKQVTLVKLPLDLYSIPSNKEFMSKYTTDDYKKGNYNITSENYNDMITILKPYSEMVTKYRLEDLHKKQMVKINGADKEVSSLAAKIHEVVDLIDEIERCDDNGVTVLEAQDLHQVIYRIKKRLEAGKLPDILFNEYLFKHSDTRAIEIIRAKRKYQIESKDNRQRLADCYDELTPLELKNSEKSARGAIEIRNTIKILINEPGD